MRILRKSYRLLWVIILSLSLIAIPAFNTVQADTGVTISVSPATTNLLSGNNFWVNLNTSDVTNLHSFQLDISFDYSVIQVYLPQGGAGVGNGLINGTVVPVTAWYFLPAPGTPSGIIRITGNMGMDGGSPIGVSGSGYIARIHFNVVGAAGTTSAITPINVTMSDKFSASITVGTPVAGVLNVTYPPVTVSINAPASVSSGDDFVARLNVNLVAKLTAYQVKIIYNPAVITLIGDEGDATGITPGLIGSTVIPVDNWRYSPLGHPETGTVVSLGHIPGAGYATGSGYLLEMHFHVLGSPGQNSPINFVVESPVFTKLFDNFGQQMNDVTFVGTSVNVISAYRITNGSPLPTGEVGVVYSQTLVATGGAPTYSYTVAAGTLPAGLTLASGGLLSGTPTTPVTNSTVTFRVTDSTLNSVNKDLVMNIVARPVITTTTLPLGSVTAFYSQNLAATGGSGIYSWALTGGSLPLGLTLSAGGVISGTPTAAGGPITFTVTVTDSLTGNASAILSITIIAGPTITTPLTLTPGEITVYYSKTLTAIGGTTPYTWSLLSGTLPPGLSFSAGGLISGTPTTAGGPTSFTIMVTDAAGAFSNATFSVTINALPIITTASPLPTGEAGIFYNKTLDVSGGLSPFTWTRTAGTMPAGLTLSLAGVISGTPTAAYNNNITVMVTDNYGKTANKVFAMNILAAPAISTGPNLPNGQIGIFYTQTLTVTGGQTPFIWSLLNGSLPVGLSLSAGGVISGTPTTVGGPISFTAGVSDAMGGTASSGLNITIVSGPTITTSSPLPLGEVSKAYSCTLLVNGGIGPYTWSVQSGSLPAGLSLSAGGIISGTPTTAVGPVFVTIRATDTSNLTYGQKDFSITIVGNPVITTSSLPNGEVNLAYSANLNVSGGIGPFTWSTVSGAWPAGLSLSAAGMVSGTPLVVASTTVSVLVTDSNSVSSAPASLAITIVSAPNIATGSRLPDGGETFAFYSVTLTGTGGVTPYSFQMAPGSSLPTGLSLTTGGLISGTPTVAGTFSFSITLTDSLGGVFSKAFNVTFTAGPVITTTSPLRSADVNVYYSLTFTATGGYEPYTWAKTAGTLPAGLNFDIYNGILSGTPTVTGTYNFTLQLTDNHYPAAVNSASFSLNVMAAPSIATPAALPNGVINVPYSQTLAVTGGTGAFTWTTLSGTWPTGLSMSSAGVISGTPTVLGGPASVMVRVRDYYNLTATTTFTISIVSTPTITTATPLPNGEVTIVYNQALTVAGGSSPFTWVVTVGTLPAGLTLSPAGVISGTPTSTGTSNFTVRVTDNLSNTDSKAFSLTISALPVITTTSPLPNGEVNLPYNKTMTATGGVTPPAYTWLVSLGSLPAGLSLTTAGVITGTPTAAGSATVTIRVSDSLGGQGSGIFTITIVAAPSITSGGTLPQGEVFLPYSQNMTLTGGVSPYTWSTVSGTWPAGLSLSGAGIISGTPTAAGGPTTVNIRVTDGNNVSSAQVAVIITILTSPSITTATPLPPGEVTIAYNQTLAGTGGKTPYTWQLMSGTLPAGLTLSGAGVLSGTPTVAGSSTFNIGLTDALGGVATPKSFTLTIAGLPVITTTSPLPNGEVNAAYNKTMNATGGVTPPAYTWSIVPPSSLPAGLSLSAAGVITGTPTAAGSTTVTIRVSDSLGGQGSGTFAITIVAAPSITSGGTLAEGEVNLPYSQNMTVTGGVSPFTWSTVSGTWPAGLSLSGAGVISGTPTTAGGPTTVNIKVTDGNNVSSPQVAVIITILTSPSITTSTPLPPGEVTIAYNQTLAGTGGKTPYTWQLQSGPLPVGLTFSAGLLSGTPTVAGNSTFNIGLTDALGGAVVKSFTLTIAALPVITTANPLPDGEVSVAYNQTLTVSGGISPFVWTVDSGTLPTGLSLSAGGIISGTPSVAVTSNLVILRVADSKGASNTGNFYITILPAVSITTDSPLPDGEVSVVYSKNLTASGGTGSYTWVLQSGTLPAGLTLSTTGLVSGTPTGTGSTVSIMARATDALGGTNTKLFSITVFNAPTIITNSPLPEGEIGMVYSATLNGTDGTAPYSWSAAGLPTGLTISTAGVISGTPQAEGVFSVIITLTDSFTTHASVNKTLSLRVYSAIQISTSSLVEVLENTNFSQNLTASGGKSPYAWSASGLPSGVNISAGGVLSGKSTIPGEYAVIITLSDNFGVSNSVSRTLTLKVYMKYDANGNGVVDMGDVVKIDRIILDFDPATPAADANSSGQVEGGDIIKIERVILGIEQ